MHLACWAQGYACCTVGNMRDLLGADSDDTENHEVTATRWFIYCSAYSMSALESRVSLLRVRVQKHHMLWNRASSLPAEASNSQRHVSISAHLTTFCHLAPPAAAEYTTPGVAFEELNQRLYDAPIVDKLDEIYEEVMAKTNSASSSAVASVSIAAIDSSVARSPTVAKSSKVAAYLVLALLMPAHAVV